MFAVVYSWILERSSVDMDDLSAADLAHSRNNLCCWNRKPELFHASQVHVVVGGGRVQSRVSIDVWNSARTHYDFGTENTHIPVEGDTVGPGVEVICFFKRLVGDHQAAVAAEVLLH